MTMPADIERIEAEACRRGCRDTLDAVIGSNSDLCRSSTAAYQNCVKAANQVLKSADAHLTKEKSNGR